LCVSIYIYIPMTCIPNNTCLKCYMCASIYIYIPMIRVSIYIYIPMIRIPDNTEHTCHTCVSIYKYTPMISTLNHTKHCAICVYRSIHTYRWYAHPTTLNIRATCVYLSIYTYPCNVFISIYPMCLCSCVANTHGHSTQALHMCVCLSIIYVCICLSSV